tara:strand:+ start:872 stop:1852 length:981 start_codon:yes stop_codon:yes gene_type:complete
MIEVKNLKEEIQKARPNIKPNSVRQYEINLKKLQKLFDTDTYDFLKNPKEVIDKMDKEEIKYLTQRNMLNAVVVLLMALNSDSKYDKLLEEYGTIRDGLNARYIKENETGDFVSEKQSKNFADASEVQGMLDKMQAELKVIKKKPFDDWTKKDKALLQVYTIFSIYSKMPMRNDVSNMIAINKSGYNKLTDDDKRENNYLVLGKDKLFFVLNKFKTSKTYGELKLPIDDKDLIKKLRYFVKMNGMGILFKTSTGKPITRIELSKLLKKTSEKYMGKSVSTTLLRKSYLTNKYGDVKKEMEKDSKVLGHDVSTTGMKVYVKENAKKE